jgi:hypothetical protein
VSTVFVVPVFPLLGASLSTLSDREAVKPTYDTHACLQGARISTSDLLTCCPLTAGSSELF